MAACPWERASMRSTSSRTSREKLRQVGSRLRNSPGLRRGRDAYGSAICEGIGRRQDDFVIRVKATNDLDVRTVVAADLYGLQHDMAVRIDRTDAQAIAAEQ